VDRSGTPDQVRGDGGRIKFRVTMAGAGLGLTAAKSGLAMVAGSGLGRRQRCDPVSEQDALKRFAALATTV
jgi:hypothetical protein